MNKDTVLLPTLQALFGFTLAFMIKKLLHQVNLSNK